MISQEDFFRELMSDIKSSAGAEETFCEEKFTEYMCDFLTDEAIINSYQTVFFKQTKQGIRIDAWDFDREKQILSLFITDFSIDDKLRTLIQTEVDKLFKRLKRFFEKCLTSKFITEQIDESDPAYPVVTEIYNNKENISKIQLYLLTNGLLSDRVKSIDKIKLDNYKTVFDIWDIGRKTKIKNSGKSKEDIVIDFTKFSNGGLDFLPASIDNASCTSYLLVFPGQLVSDVYDEYGDRLLEQNVRTFLQFRSGVNKSIKNTLTNEPEMFFAYNNGLTVTAEELKIENNKMLEAKNLQIVNGGQTTASIFMSKLLDKKNIKLDDVYLQVKLSVIDVDKVDDIVPIISKASNTQNKVNAADFFSNHPFHKRIEDFSRRILAPAQEGTLAESYWFYERARGQYANKQAKLTSSDKKKFLLQNPKVQMFTKTDLAMYENTFNQMPHFVCKGPTFNFAKFAEEITGKGEDGGLWSKDDKIYNKLYYKDLISKAIIFKYFDGLLSKPTMRPDWYISYKRQVVVYTLSRYAFEIAKNGLFFNFENIWKKQDIDQNMKDDLIRLGEIVSDHITEEAQNDISYFKKQACWDNIKNLPFSLTDGQSQSTFEKLDRVKEKKEDAKKQQKILSGVEAQVAVVEKGSTYWSQLYNFVSLKNIFTEKELSILLTTNRINTNPPSWKQCVIILKLEQEAIDYGFYYKEN